MKRPLRSSFQNNIYFTVILHVILIALLSCSRKNTVTNNETSVKDQVIEAPKHIEPQQSSIDTIKKPKDAVKKDKVIEAPKHNAPEQAEIDSIKKAKSKHK